MKNPRFANALGGIVVTQDNGRDLLLESGDIYQQAVAGAFGEVRPLTAPPAAVNDDPLFHLKASKRAAIEAARAAACYADVTASGRTWQADARSQDLLANAVRRGRAGKPLPPKWRDRDNSDMPVASVADLEAIEDAIAAQTQAAYEKSWTLKARIDAATTAEEVEAVQW